MKILTYYPIIAFLSHHLLWILAWVEFGRRPYPDNMRHPSDITDPFTGLTAFFWNVPMWLTLLLFIIAIIFFIYGIINLIKRKDNWKKSIQNTTIFFVLFALYIILWKVDPGRIVYWYYDS